MTPENYHDFLKWLELIQWQENENGALDESKYVFQRVREMAVSQFLASACDAAHATRNMRADQ